MRTNRFEKLGLAGEAVRITQQGEIAAPHSKGRAFLAYVMPLVTLAAAFVIQHLSGATIVHEGASEIVISMIAAALLLGTVFIVLHHAEALAVELREPFGTLLLTIAVTIIEVSIIVSVMLHGDANPYLAREAVFSVVMIVCTGLVGTCLTLGALRNYEQDLKQQGTSAFLAVLLTLAVLILILPDFTLTANPGSFSSLQLVFVSALSLLLYSAFLFMQMVRHRRYFIDENAERHKEAVHPTRSGLEIALHATCLVAGLLAVVMLAKRVAAGVEDGLHVLQVEQGDAIVGALIAFLVLLPEALVAIRAAMRNELQRALNVALGSALATIGLTIPTVATISLLTGTELILGLDGGDMVLLAVTLTLCIISFGTGRTTVLTGIVHLVVFVAYVLLIAIP
ncbi:MAG: ionic transporter [Rhizobiales bacterium]|nr:ionic transporter [Hyphomicrobiales bacterium]